MAISRILVPVDYSAYSKAALELAAGIAGTLGATVDVVNVWDRPLYISETIKVLKDGEPRALIELIRESAQREMDEFLAKVELPPNVRLSHRLLSGNPAHALLDELRLGQHQLLVVGTHGRTGLPHLLLGSVAETLVRLSPVPVLTVPLPRHG